MKRIVTKDGLWTRRVVLQRAMHLSALGVATPLAINLAAVGEAAAFDASDYKALVCVFMDWRQRLRQHGGALRPG